MQVQDGAWSTERASDGVRSFTADSAGTEEGSSDRGEGESPAESLVALGWAGLVLGWVGRLR